MEANGRAGYVFIYKNINRVLLTYYMKAVGSQCPHHFSILQSVLIIFCQHIKCQDHFVFHQDPSIHSPSILTQTLGEEQ